MTVIDINGKELEITDLPEAISQADNFRQMYHEDPQFASFDEVCKAYWEDLYNKLVEISQPEEITFILTMLKKKGIELDTPLLESKGHIGLNIQMLMDFISQCNQEDIVTIRDMFSKIESANGDLMDYIGFLADGMVKAMGLEFFETTS